VPLIALTRRRPGQIYVYLACHKHIRKRIIWDHPSQQKSINQAPSPPRQASEAVSPSSPVDSGQAPESCATKTLSAETSSRLKSPWYHFRSRPACPRGLGCLGRSFCCIGRLAHAVSEPFGTPIPPAPGHQASTQPLSLLRLPLTCSISLDHWRLREK
jgi:hypothetical protein